MKQTTTMKTKNTAKKNNHKYKNVNIYKHMFRTALQHGCCEGRPNQARHVVHAP